MATVSCRAVRVEVRSMGLSGSSGSPRASMTNGTSFFLGWRASLSPTAMPVMTAPVAERFIQLLKRSGSFRRRPSRRRPRAPSRPRRRAGGIGPLGGCASGPSSAGSGLGFDSTRPRYRPVDSARTVGSAPCWTASIPRSRSTWRPSSPWRKRASRSSRPAWPNGWARRPRRCRRCSTASRPTI